MSDPVRGPLGRLSEHAAAVLIAAAGNQSHALGLAADLNSAWSYGLWPPLPPPDEIAAALDELRERVLR